MCSCCRTHIGKALLEEVLYRWGVYTCDWKYMADGKCAIPGGDICCCWEDCLAFCAYLLRSLDVSGRHRVANNSVVRRRRYDTLNVYGAGAFDRL
jgi:hypothetical protein